METGCVFDNHRGIYMGEAIIELAESYGMPPSVLNGDEGLENSAEVYFWLWEKAENFLNTNVAEEGYMFGYGECGDFMYMPIEWWEEE